MKRFFCTYLDKNYLPRGLALYQSLKRHASPFELFVLCLDQPSHQILSQLQSPELTPPAPTDHVTDRASHTGCHCVSPVVHQTRSEG